MWVVFHLNATGPFFVVNAPSPTTVSFTGNIGLDGYTGLSPQIYADVRGKADASCHSCTRPIVVRAYKGVVFAPALFNRYIIGGVLGIALVLGALADLFVPALPFNIPRRVFGLFSWGGSLGRVMSIDRWISTSSRRLWARRGCTPSNH